jgi:hypothetical protein
MRQLRFSIALQDLSSILVYHWLCTLSEASNQLDSSVSLLKSFTHFYTSETASFSSSGAWPTAYCQFADRCTVVSTAQMVGGIVANAILAGLTPGGLDVQLVLGVGTNPAQGVFIEMFATSALVLSVLMLGAEKHLLTPHAPLAFAFTLFALTLATIQYTGTGLK